MKWSSDTIADLSDEHRSQHPEELISGSWKKKTMARLRYSDVKILLLLFSYLLTKGHCQDESFITGCFSDGEAGNDVDTIACEKSRINIKGIFYKCESALRFKNPIKRIDFFADNILLLAGKQSFVVDESTSPGEVKPVRMIVPQRTEFFDGKGFRYLGGSNMVYIQKIQDSGIVEVITHNASESYNTIAVDDLNNNLFIFSQYEDENFGLKRESLYVVSLNSLNTEADKINADSYRDLKNVTTIAYNHQKKFLYIGLQLPNGEGKLIKVKGQADDPCAISDGTKQEISSAIADFTDKIFNVLNKTASLRNAEGGEMNLNDELLQLKWEKNELQTQLNATILQLNKLRETFYSSAGAFGGGFAPASHSYPSSGGSSFSSGGSYPSPGGLNGPLEQPYSPSTKPYPRGYLPSSGSSYPSPGHFYPSADEYENTQDPSTNTRLPSNVYINIFLSPHQQTK